MINKFYSEHNHELKIPIQRSNRDAKTGRFLKGYTPYNKGKKWEEFKTKRGMKRSMKGWANLQKYRFRPPTAGKPPKPVVAILDDGR